MPQYETVVGNIGTVYYGSDKEKAIAEFNDYVEISKNDDTHRAFGEDVTVFENGVTYSEIIMEHIGHLFGYDDQFVVGD